MPLIGSWEFFFTQLMASTGVDVSGFAEVTFKIEMITIRRKANAKGTAFPFMTRLHSMPYKEKPLNPLAGGASRTPSLNYRDALELISEFPQEGFSVRNVFLGLHSEWALPVDDAQYPPSTFSLSHDDLNGIGRSAKDPTDLRNSAD